MPFNAEDLIRRITGKSSQEGESVIHPKQEHKPESSKEKPKPTFLQKEEIKGWSQEKAEEVASRDIHHLILTMYPEDFLFLLEKISIDTWRKIFGSLTEGEISLMTDKVESKPVWKDRLAVLMGKIKPKDKYITQEIATEYEQMISLVTHFTEKIKEGFGYDVNPPILKKDRPYNENKKITEKELEEINETIVDLKTLLTIIEEKKKLINSGSTFSGGVDMNNTSFNEGDWDIAFVKSSKNTWDIASAYQFSLATEEFRKYLRNKSTNRTKKVKTQPMKKVTPKK